MTTSRQTSTSGRVGFDVIIGNPPFLNQLESATASERGSAAIMRLLTDGVVKGYADLSAAFLYCSSHLCRDSGRVTLIQPQSFLAAKDAGPVRSGLLKSNALVALWVSNEHAFEGVSVFTCAPSIEIGGPRVGRLTRAATTKFDRLPDVEIDNNDLASEETWAHLVAAASGIPEIDFVSHGSVGDIATATADFRDQYYGLAGFLIEDAHVGTPGPDIDQHYPPIVTTGLIDLAIVRWGRSTTHILKSKWQAPRIDRRRMNAEGDLGPWITNRLVPKIIFATQTKVIEAFVDEPGRYVPSLPLISIVPVDRADLWLLGAAIASPVTTALVMRKYSGAALCVEAIRISAKQVLTLPLPRRGEAWHHAAAMLRAAHQTDDASRDQWLLEFAQASIAAFGVSESQAQPLMRWWIHRFTGTSTVEEATDEE